MKRKMKLFSFTIVFSIIAIGSIICNIFWIEYAHPLVRLNPILDLLSPHQPNPLVLGGFFFYFQHFFRMFLFSMFIGRLKISFFIHEKA